MGKFVVKATKTGFVFNLKAGNGEVIATSESSQKQGHMPQRHRKRTQVL